MGKAEIKALDEALQIGEAKADVARQQLQQFKQESAERDLRIAQAHEFIGRVQANTLMAKFANVSNLVHLKNIKESKIYRDLPMVGTWDKYCDYIGLSRQKVDEDLMNLAAFGEDFMTTCQQFSLGYRDLRKLRQLAHDGTVTIDAEAVVIGEERIPLDQDHREDLQAAIEKIIDEQAQVKAELSAQKKAFDRVQTDTHKSMTKLQKELDKFTAAAELKGLTADEDAFMQRMELHRISAQGAMIALEPLELAKEYMNLSPRMVARAISIAHELKMQALALYDTMVSEIGNHVMNPEMIEDYAKWEEENGFASSPLK